MCKPPAAISLLLLLLLPSAKGAERWTHLKTQHFEMFTTNSEKSARDALTVFEQVRYFFVQNSHSKTAPDAAVRIIAFRSEKEYKPYRLNEGSFAYYQRSQKVDYIVMQDISPEHYQAAVHEYTHLVVEHQGLKLPVWLNEGLADLYSSLEAKGNQSLVGRPLEGHSMVLQTQRWMDFNTLFAVDHDSPYYNEKEKMSIFYAQSWALTHMLALGKNYMPGFPRFMASLESGHSTSESFQSVYGKTTEQVVQDLHSYINQSTVRGVLFDVKLSRSELDVDVSEPTQFSVDLTLADLLASRKATMAEASERLAQLAQSYPRSPEVEESIGYLAWQQGNPQKAIESFKLATEKGSTNAQMILQYAQLLYSSTQKPDEVLPLFRKVVELAPDNQEAWFSLGMTETQASEFGAALDAFSHLKSVSPDRAYSLFSAQAFCYLRLNAPKPARVRAEKAREYAKTPQEQSQIENLLRAADSMDHPGEGQAASSTVPLSSSERPSLARNRVADIPRDVPSIVHRGEIKHVEAITEFLDCSTPNRRWHVLVDSQEMVLEFDSPDNIVVRNTPDGYLNLECGAQKPHSVSIFYIPTKDTAVQGLIRELVF